jgi:hypothetical protein
MKILYLVRARERQDFGKRVDSRRLHEATDFQTPTRQDRDEVLRIYRADRPLLENGPTAGPRLKRKAFGLRGGGRTGSGEIRPEGQDHSLAQPLQNIATRKIPRSGILIFFSHFRLTSLPRAAEPFSPTEMFKHSHPPSWPASPPAARRR